MNGRAFVLTEDGYQPLPYLYEVEEELEEEPTPWPKENPHIIKAADEASFTCEINSPGLAAFLNSHLTPEVKLLAKMIDVIADALRKYPNRRVLHLATHGSPRVRKKNVKRLVRYYKKLRKD